MKIKGFTLIELMVSITIVIILSGVAIMGLTSVRQKAQDTSYLSSFRDLQISLEAFKSVTGSYPSVITELVPTYISKIPLGPGLTTSPFTYNISSDKKSYCLYVVGKIFNPSTQSSMNCSSSPKTWVVCKGPNVAGANNLNCPNITSQ